MASTPASTKPLQSEDALVSIGLPVRNGARTLEGVVKSVLAQDHERLELVISDNASTDDTEELCRDLASADDRIVYFRQSANVGLLGNFVNAMRLAKGTFFRWVGDDDSLAANYVSRCLEEFARDDRLVLVTTQLNYVHSDGSTQTFECSDKTFYSGDTIERFEKYVTYLIDGFLPVDPLYGLARRATLTTITRRNSIREDQVFAGQLALAGPWGHVPEALGTRHVGSPTFPQLARRLEVPIWQALLPTFVQCREMLHALDLEDITKAERRRARAAVGRLCVVGQYRSITRRVRELIGIERLPRSR